MGLQAEILVLLLLPLSRRVHVASEQQQEIKQSGGVACTLEIKRPQL